MAIIEYTRPEHARLWRISVKPFPPQPMENFKVGWITYFADPAVGGKLPEGIRTEPVAGGILIQARDEPPMPPDTQEVAAIATIFNALQGAGVLKRKR